MSDRRNLYRTAHAAADTWERDKGVRPSSHRFTPKKAREIQGKVYGGLRHVRDETPDTLPLSTFLLTLEGWPYDDEGRPAPPVEFLQGLVQGRGAAINDLRRRLDGVDTVRMWGYAWIMEPHDQRDGGEPRKGYPHCHVGGAIVGDVTREDVAPVVVGENSSYVQANPYARPEDHGADACRLHDVERGTDVVETLAGELTNGLAGYKFDLSSDPVQGVPVAYRRFGALLWSTGKQLHHFGSTFRDWVARSQQEWSPDDERECHDTDSYVPSDGGAPTYVEPDPVPVAFNFPDGGGDVE